jgi:hypothetical protein
MIVPSPLVNSLKLLRVVQSEKSIKKNDVITYYFEVATVCGTIV